MVIFCMMLLSVFTYSAYTGLHGTGTATSQNMHNRLTNSGDMWGILDSHLDEGRMKAPELDTRDNARGGNRKKRIVKREDTGLNGSGIDTSKNVYNRLTNNKCIWSVRDNHLEEERIRVPDLDAWDNARDGKIRILMRENIKVWRTLILPLLWLSVICIFLFSFLYYIFRSESSSITRT